MDSDIELTINIFKLLNTDNEPIAFSPISILNNLAVIFAGSDDSTGDQISKVIGNGMPKHVIIEKYINLMEYYNKLNNISFGHVYCKNLFLTDEEFNSSGIEVMQKFNAEHKHQNFGDNFIKEINDCLMQNTNNQISKAVTENDIIPTKSTITIVNALFVDHEWDNPFTSSSDQFSFWIPPYTPYSFRKASCIIQQTESKEWNLTNGNTWSCLGIPYKHRKTWLHILIPKERGGLNELIEKFDVDMFRQCIAKSVAGKMDVIIPIFEIENKISFNQILIKLGLSEIFNDKIVTKMLNQSCHVNTILQSTKIKINQNGLQKKPILTPAQRKERIKMAIDQGYKANYDFEEWCRLEREEDGVIQQFRADQSFIYFVTLVNESTEDLRSIIAMGKYC